MRFSLFILMIVLSSCSAKWHLNKATQKDPSLLTEKVDTVEREVIVPEVKTDTVFKSTEGDTVYIEKDKLKIKYIDMPGDTVYIEGKCEEDTVVVYDTKTTTVYKLPPTYKEFIKSLLGLSNFEFWLFHSLAALVLLGFLFFRYLGPLLGISAGGIVSGLLLKLKNRRNNDSDP
jgi:hypothetical protein